jgi:hypothetical protein
MLANEQTTTRTAGTSPPQVGGDRFSNLRRQRHVSPLSAFTAYRQTTLFPIDVIERHGHNFARPQTEPSQQQQDRIVTPAHRRASIAAREHLLHLSWLKELG